MSQDQDQDQKLISPPLQEQTNRKSVFRDLFIFCPTLKMAAHWANSGANVFLYHQPETSAYNRYLQNQNQNQLKEEL